MKKLLMGFIIGAITLQMAACGSATTEPVNEQTQETANQTDQETQTEENTAANAQIANPWRDITEDQAYGMIPNCFSAPEGATNIRWSAMGEADAEGTLHGPLVQLDFDLDNLSFTERAQITGDEAVDISGMYYDWTVSDDVTLANWGDGAMKGKTYRSIEENETADLITWYDVEIGISYSLSTVAPDLDGFDIQAIAEQTYDPSKQVGAGMPDDDHEPMDITGCDTFTQIVDRLQPGQGYANANLVNQDVLLVSSGTFDLDVDQGKRFGAIDADIYMYDKDGSIVYLGYVQAGGTAYPLAMDSDKHLCVGGNHNMAKMTIDDNNRIAVDEEVYVLYDSNGNGTYYHVSDVAQVEQDPEGKLNDDSLFNLFFENYSDAEVILFDTVH